MTENATHKYRLIIKTAGPRLLYPITNAFCSDSGMSFNDARSKLTTTGAILELASKEQADNAAAKYKKLGCSVVEADFETFTDETVNTEAGPFPFQEDNEHLGAFTETKPSDEENTGFAGIGKRLDDLRTGGSFEDANAWKQADSEPQQKKKPEAVKRDSQPKVYTPKKSSSSFRLSFAKVFWGIIGLVIIFSIFSENSKKTTTNYKSSSQPTRQYSSPASGNDLISVGQYRCTRYHDNRAQELKPRDYEKQFIESEQSALASLKMQIEADYVDHSSQVSVDSHNMLIDGYNSRLQRVQWSIDSYNNKVNTYNNYLMNNCSRAY